MKRKKINLAVIFYGRADQLEANQTQFSDLKNNLFDFNVKKYDFNAGEQSKLLNDFKNKEIDVVLKNSYGRGHETDLEEFLELNKIPYFGSGAKATFLGTSKLLSKKIFRLHNLPVVEEIFVDKIIWRKNKKPVLENVANKIGFPCLIKDIGGTDSRGIYKINGQAQVKKVLNKAVAAHAGVIVEKFISNAYEIVCLAVGNKNPAAYEPVALISEQGIYTAKLKDKARIKTEIPAPLPPEIIKKIKKITVLAHKALACRTFSRADILVKNNKLYLLEVDVHPGFRKVSPTSISAAYAGQNMNQLFLKFYKLVKQSL